MVGEYTTPWWQTAYGGPCGVGFLAQQPPHQAIDEFVARLVEPFWHRRRRQKRRGKRRSWRDRNEARPDRLDTEVFRRREADERSQRGDDDGVAALRGGSDLAKPAFRVGIGDVGQVANGVGRLGLPGG